MALYFRKKGSEFGGEFQIAGERHRIELGVKVKGQKPVNLRYPGDAEFERSRGRAMAVLADKKKEILDPKQAADRLKRIHEIASGAILKTVHPEELEGIWQNALRKKPLTKKHKNTAASAFKSFTKFLAKKYPRADDLRAVKKSMANGFMRSEQNRGIAPKTYDNILTTLHAAFEAACTDCELPFNPFSDIKKKKVESIHNKPYLLPELARILEAAKTEDLIGGMVITAICTGLRRENCATLRWRDLNEDLTEIQVRALKNDEALFIPVFPPLRQYLEKLKRDGEYCFPDAAKMGEKNNEDGWNWRLHQMLKRNGFEIDLNEIEDEQRLRRASKHGFHRFKTTFVTLALNSGVSMEMLQKVVGNQIVELVKKVYYRPSKDDVIREFKAKFPQLIMDEGAVTGEGRISEAIKMLEHVDSRNWRSEVSEVRALLLDVQKVIQA